MNHEARRRAYVKAAIAAGAVVITTPNRILTEEERRDRATAGPFFRANFDEETGVYRECPACDGWGEFPGEEGAKGCKFCEAFADSDYEACQESSPPISFKVDRPGDIESAKKLLSFEVLSEAVKSPAAFQDHWKAMQEDQERRRHDYAQTVPHYVFKCNECRKQKCVEKGSSWSWRWVEAPRCCGRQMKYIEQRELKTEQPA